jgi:hypothetical protein
MRGPDEKQGEVFSYIPLEDRIPRDHPLRRIRPMVDRGLEEMWSHFEALYARRGRPSIAPERLLRALLLQALYSIRSETQLMEQLDYNLLYRWFVGMNADDRVWDVTVFREIATLTGGGAAASGGARSAERGTFHGGWDVDPGLGQQEEFRAQAGAAGERERIGREEIVAGHA